MICGNCGGDNAADARFCAHCGMYLNPKTAKPSTPEPAPPEPDIPPAVEAPVAPTAPAQPAPETEAARESQERLRPGTRPASDEIETAPAALDEAVAHVLEGQRLAEEHNRPDLASRLEAARSALVHQTYSVAVIGEFKQGKSTLVNALLQTEVCPVDADLVTAVPTLVTYADQPYAAAHFQPVDGAIEGTVQPIQLTQLMEFVSEAENAENRKNLRMVEIGVRHRLLRSGMRLIDTPGVGGLESAQGVMTMSTLSTVQGALFVTDASQELTQPEVEFLMQAAERCPSVTVVVTKIDLYPEWRRIVEIDTRHLAATGLDVAVIPVSSFLRLRAIRDPGLSEESGFRALIRHLASAVIGAANAALADAAASEVRFVAKQLARPVEAERSVIEVPAEAERVVAELTETKSRTAALAGPSATWQQVLADGIQDLASDVEHDLRARLRLVVRDIDAIVDESDPKTSWTDTEIWLRRQVALVAVANRDLLAARTSSLVDKVAQNFNLDASEITLTSVSPLGALEQVVLPGAEHLNNPVGRLGPALIAGRLGVLVPATTAEVLRVAAGGLMWGSGGPLTIGIALGATLGFKLFRGETNRQVAYRRQQGKVAAHKYVDDVRFELEKYCRDTLVETQRMLRDQFQYRALSLHHSSTAALASAVAAKGMDEQHRAARAAELNEQSRQFSRLGNQPVGAGAPGSAGGSDHRV